jgi:hypothetical protein
MLLVLLLLQTRDNSLTVSVPTCIPLTLYHVLLLLLLQTGDNSLTVSELPVRTWTQPYKEFLESLLKGADKDKEKGAAAARKKKTAGDEEGGGCCGYAGDRFALEGGVAAQGD